MTTEILTVADLAKLLKISPRSVYELTRERHRRSQANPLPLVRINGKTVRFRKCDVETWLETKAKEAA